ncbi:unnamed protein product [Rotaria socialis]|uniref:Methyltransferase domain-containing protein n=1 Tax=Rotaria socialis TaxID=392032 RepID=A0A818B6G3_9BILA|nr:unnamed protein product [Rotaria socialis]CAF4589975.1 unnamed protein product [Rotaria socialis]
MTDNDFLGIYKKPNNKHLIVLYYEARQSLNIDDIDSAKRILQQAIEYGLNHSLVSDVRILKCIEREIEFYTENKLSNKSASAEINNLNIADIFERQVQLWCEKWSQLPQSVFYLRMNLSDGQQYPMLLVGRKHLSKLFLTMKIPELHCSQVQASMLLGILHHTHASESTVRIYYYPLEFDEKRYLFNLIAKNHLDHKTELIYPFCLLHPSTHRELRSESDGWLLTDSMVNELGQGETHIRQYTIHMLKNKYKQEDSCTLYDSACSTGQFLAELKYHFPLIHTIGQDLSESMIQFVLECGTVDEALHADAKLWPLGDRQVDVAFIRFLNSEIMATEDALTLFQKIATRVKSDGLIIIFGHTPVLLSSCDFIRQGCLELKQCIGVMDGTDITLFQYYVLKVKKSTHSH